MPILAWGSFLAQTTDPENAFVKNNAAHFTFKPVYPALVIVALLVLIGLLLRYRQGGKHYSRWRWLALLPGLVGVVLALLPDMDEAFVFFVPLQLVTLLLILWKVFRLKNIWLMHLMGICVSATLLYLNYIVRFPYIVWSVIPYFLIFGSLLYLGCILFLLLNRKRSSISRWFVGLLLGSILPALGLGAFVWFFMHTPPWIVFIGAGYLALFVVPFAILARWNSWARDIVSGEIYEIIRKS